MMSNPVPDQSSATKLAINKQILELKKKIQLSGKQSNRICNYFMHLRTLQIT